MDPISQAAIGAACAQVSLPTKYDNRTIWLAGALGGMAPDLDVLIRSSTDPLLSLIYHRQFTHSLIFIPVGGLVVTLFLLLFKRFRAHWTLTWLAATIGYATHGLLDALTSYGTVLYWPFTNRRVAWDVIAIIDPWFTIPLILGVIWTIKFGSRKGVVVGLSFSTMILALNMWQHHRALEGVNDYAKQHHFRFSKLRVFPKLASRTQWGAIAYFNQQWFIADVDVPLSKASQIHPIAWCPMFTKKTQLATPFSGLQSKDLRVFNWFADGYLMLAKTHPVLLVDGRYLWDNNPLVALWGIKFNPGQQHIERVRFIPLTNCNYIN